jgi:hypothetical protein
MKIDPEKTRLPINKENGCLRHSARAASRTIQSDGMRQPDPCKRHESHAGRAAQEGKTAAAMAAG